jgi:hypothetical protein
VSGEHDHGGHDHDHDHDHEDEQEDVPDMSEWISTTKPTTCPACGAAGAVTPGGGVFCPACGVVTTNPGYAPPPDPPAS